MGELEFVTSGFCADTLSRDETLFHCANGYLGVRGSLEEGAFDDYASVRGTYINGFCDEEEISYGERLYGFPQTKQVMVNLPDAQSVLLRAEGRLIAARDAEARDMVRRLDLAAGTVERTFSYRTTSGTLRIKITRLASFLQKELFLLRYTVTSIDFSGEIQLESILEGSVKNFSDPEDPRVASEAQMKLIITRRLLERDVLALSAKTIRSGRKLGCACAHQMDGALAELTQQGNRISTRFSRMLLPGQSATLTKYCAYTDAPEEEDLLKTACKLALNARENGFAYYEEAQRAYLDAFWNCSRVHIDGDEQTQSYLDLCVYELLCAVGQNGRSSVAAKGLSGEGYEGHYFWDCETYVFPFFLSTAPEMAKKLLDYRFHLLDAARVHARTLGHVRGALYPWRTITGSECSAYYPSGSAQYHINADIAHAFCQYWYATHDLAYLPSICEVLVETARLFLDVGHMLEGQFRIDGVTGPDEYTCIVDNNYYTNVGAAKTFSAAVALCETLEASGGFDALRQKAGVTKEELDRFSEAAKAMYLPMDDRLGICKQDDSFLNKQRWELSEIPPENFPLLMHYHPLFINRRQVCKQADTVLAHFLYREETPLVMRRSYAYYEQVTTHDSSLSACVFSMMAARLGDCEKAMEYFNATVGIDLDDQSGNTRDGLHIANMGGAYLSIVAGFGGMRLDQDGLRLFPQLPERWKAYAFPISHRGSRILVSVDPNGCALKLLEGVKIEVMVYDQTVPVTEQETRIARPVRGIIFDLDGVITDTAWFHFAAWKRIADELGIPFDEKRNERFKGVSRAQCLKLLLEEDERERTPEEKTELENRKNAYYVEALSTLSRKDILPGILETLALLRERKIPCALFSVSKNTSLILEKIGLSSQFDAVVDGTDITYSKPHFEGYLLAAERISIDPRLCVMVEDAKAGLEGARALSMRTIGIGEALPRDAADIVLRDTGALLQAMEDMMREYNDFTEE